MRLAASQTSLPRDKFKFRKITRVYKIPKFKLVEVVIRIADRKFEKRWRRHRDQRGSHRRWIFCQLRRRPLQQVLFNRWVSLRSRSSSISKNSKLVQFRQHHLRGVERRASFQVPCSWSLLVHLRRLKIWKRLRIWRILPRLNWTLLRARLSDRMWRFSRTSRLLSLACRNDSRSVCVCTRSH